MPTLTEAIHDRLAADATIIGLVSQYQGEPAIFAFDPIPENIIVAGRYIVIHGAEVDEPNDTKTCVGRNVRQHIRCYDLGQGSVTLIDQLGERIRELFHRQPVGLLDGAYAAACSGPMVAPTDPDLYGRDVIVHIESLV